MLGAAHSISWDYLPRVPQGEAAERHVSWKEKPVGNFIARRILHQDVKSSFDLPLPRPQDEEMLSEKVSEKTPANSEATEIPRSEPDLEAVVHSSIDPGVQLLRKTSRLSTYPVQEQPRLASISCAPAASSPVPPVPPPTPAQSVRNFNARSITSRSATLNPPTLRQTIVRLFRPLAAVVTPVTIALAISLPIALVNPLKALFVDISDVSSYSFKGPDGRPPLAFLIDTGASSSVRNGRSIHRPLHYFGISFPSKLHRQHHRSSCTHSSRCELRATADPAPALALAYHGHVLIDAREDGRAARDRHFPRAGDDCLRVRGQGRQGSKIRHDFLELHANSSQVGVHPLRICL